MQSSAVLLALYLLTSKADDQWGLDVSGKGCWSYKNELDDAEGNRRNGLGAYDEDTVNSNTICLDADMNELAGECRNPIYTISDGSGTYPEGTAYTQLVGKCRKDTRHLDTGSIQFLPGSDPCGPCVSALNGVERGAVDYPGTNCYMMIYGAPLMDWMTQSFTNNNATMSSNQCCNLGDSPWGEAYSNWETCNIPTPTPTLTEPTLDDLVQPTLDDLVQPQNATRVTDSATTAGASLALTIAVALF